MGSGRARSARCRQPLPPLPWRAQDQQSRSAMCVAPAPRRAAPLALVRRHLLRAGVVGGPRPILELHAPVKHGWDARRAATIRATPAVACPQLCMQLGCGAGGPAHTRRGGTAPTRDRRGHPQHQARKHNSPFHFPMSRGVSPMVYLRGRGALNQVIQGFFYGAEWNRVMIIAIRMLIEHMNGITCRPLLPEAARRFETAPAAYQPLSWQTRRMLCHRTAGCRAGERSTPSGDTATPRINS